MPPSSRAPWPLLRSSMLGGAALCLFMYSLKTAVPNLWEVRTGGGVESRRLARPVQDTAALPPPRRPKEPSQSSERDHPRRTKVHEPTPERNSYMVAEEKAGGVGCWIFMHLQKCGGSTVKKLLADRWGPRYFVYDSMRWKFGDKFSREFGEKLASGKPWNVMTGGYTEALRRAPAVDDSCRFLTLFRHPISRLVSAYFYCQDLEADVACASNIVRARDVDLLTFAKHWSNFAVRQFALSMVPADDVMAYVRTPEARALLPESIESVDDVAGWYLMKMYLERPEADVRGVASGQQPQWGTTAVKSRETEQTEEGEEEEDANIPDAQMFDFLEPAQALLSNGYAAVGILEHWNTTLSLFDKALEMPEMDWQHDFQEEGRQNVDVRFEDLKAETLEKAWTDPELKRYLHLDLLLYEHAVAVFHEQARSYGLQVPE
eukprot:g14645.t1